MRDLYLEHLATRMADRPIGEYAVLQFGHIFQVAINVREPDGSITTQLFDANLVAQKRARWLLSRAGDLFIE